MPQSCAELKTEYERLKTLKEAFVLEYAKIDEASDLVKVKKLKKELESFRKEFKDRLVVSLERAREIMGENYYGPEEIEDALGFRVSELEIPPIPYSHEALKQAEKLGEKLIFRVSHDEDGNPLTMKRINELGQIRIGDESGKFLYYTDSCKDEDFYKNSPLRTEWKLVGGSLIENSTGKNYIGQTRVLRNYLKSINCLSAEEEIECSDERLDEIDKIMHKDLQEAVKLLINLKINRNHRRSPAEIIYDWFLQFKKTKHRGFLRDNNEWSNVCSSNGGLVEFGRVDVGGGFVTWWLPFHLRDDLGVVSVR